MNRADLLIYLGLVVAVGIAVLNMAMLISPDVFNIFAKSGGYERLLGEEKKWAFESTIWTAMFALTLLAIFIYLIELRRYPEKFKR